MEVKVIGSIKLGIFVFFSVAVLLIATSYDYGVAWDEPFYIDQGEAFQRFYTNISSGGTDYNTATGRLFKELKIDGLYLNTKEAESHPFVYRELLGLALSMAGSHVDILFVSRLTTILFVSALSAAFYLIAWKITRSEFFAFLAPIMLLSCPRFFAHSHFAVLDAPATVCIFGGTACFINGFYSQADVPAGRDRAICPAKCSLILSAVLLGIACGIKETSLIIMVPLSLFFFFYREKTVSAGVWLVVFYALVLIVFFIANIPFLLEPGLLCVIVKKWLSRAEWSIPVIIAGKYFNNNGPWYYHLVYIFTTTPILHLVLGFYALLIKTDDLKENGFIKISFLTLVVYLIIFMLPFAPRFDGVRLILPVFPFLSLLSFIGLWNLYKRLGSYSRNILVLFVMAISIYNPVRYHPYELSYYNCMVGGLRGAAKKGFTVTYWCEALTPETFAEIQKVIPQRAKVAFLPFGKEVIDYYHKHNAVPGTWHIVNRQEINRSHDIYIILQKRDELFYEEYADLFKSINPIYRKKLFDVPLIQVFYRQ